MNPIHFVRYMAAFVFCFGQFRFMMGGSEFIAINATLAAIFILLFSHVFHTESRSR